MPNVLNLLRISTRVLPFRFSTGGHEFQSQRKPCGSRVDEQGHCILVIAEGAGQEFVKVSGTDAGGNPLLGDIGPWLCKEIKESTKKECMKQLREWALRRYGSLEYEETFQQSYILDGVELDHFC